MTRITIPATLVILAASLATLSTRAQDQPVNALTKAEKKEGWKLLFNGKNTKGWHWYGHPDAQTPWTVQDGAFTPDSTSKNHGDLVTDDNYDNFDLKLEWKISKTGNSGILFYVQEDTAKYKQTYFTGPEMQVLDNDGNHDGKIHAHRAGDLYDLIASSSEPVKPVGQWNQVEIISNKGELKLFLNGVNVVTTTMWDDHWKDMIAHSKFKRWSDFGVAHNGKLALQYHDFPVWYRNIRIKKL